MTFETLPATAFINPAVLSCPGIVDYDMYTNFRSQFDKASDQEIAVIEISTFGGEPEVARMMERMYVCDLYGAQTALRVFRQGGDLLGGHDLHELFCAAGPVPRAGNAPYDHERKLSKSRDRRSADDLHRDCQGDP